MNPFSSREVLPLSSGTRVPPHAPLRILGRPPNGQTKHAPLTLEHLTVSGAGTQNGARDWIVNDIEIDGVSQLSVKDLSGALFSYKGIVAGGRHAMSGIRFSGLDVIESESEVAVTITYVGPNPEGVPFFGAIVGSPPPQRSTVLPFATKQPLPPSVKTTISATLDTALKVRMLEISDEGTRGGSADWIVNDVRVDGTTQFAQSGDIPGDMFSTSSIDSFVTWKPGKQIEIDVTYIGLEEAGVCFSGCFLGTVVRDDYDQPPPDVHAIVHASNDTSAEKVVARCNWRAPYVRAIDPDSDAEAAAHRQIAGDKPVIVILADKDKES